MITTRSGFAQRIQEVGEKVLSKKLCLLEYTSSYTYSCLLCQDKKQRLPKMCQFRSTFICKQPDCEPKIHTSSQQIIAHYLAEGQIQKNYYYNIKAISVNKYFFSRPEQNTAKSKKIYK